MEEDGVIYTMDVGKTLLDTLPLRQQTDSSRLDFRAGTSLIYDGARRAVWGSAQPTGGEKGGMLIRYDLTSGMTRSFPIPYPPQVMELGEDQKLYLGVSDPSKVGLLLRFHPDQETFEEVEATVADYRRAAERAKEAGFDGIEVHSANGYLLDEFLQSKTNHKECVLSWIE